MLSDVFPPPLAAFGKFRKCHKTSRVPFGLSKVNICMYIHKAIPRLLSFYLSAVHQ